MSVPVFVDTNILVYADDRSVPLKREQARSLLRDLMRERTGRISLQSLDFESMTSRS